MGIAVRRLSAACGAEVTGVDFTRALDADSVRQIHQALGENCLLVDRPSDLLYLQWASEELRTRGRTGLDPRWVVTPCGGIRKVGSFLTLFGGHHLHVAVPTAFAPGEKTSVRSLREISAELADRGFVADSGRPYEAMQVSRMLERPFAVAASV